MKRLKNIAALLLLAAILLSICGCSSDAERLYAKSTLVYEQMLSLNTKLESAGILHYKLKEGCRDRLNLLFFVSANNENLNPDQILVNDLYVLDLDTGHWYMDSQIDENELNFETKENAIGFFYHAFDRTRGEPSIWRDDVKVDYLPEGEINRLNEMFEQNVQAKVRKTCHEESINLNLNPIRLFLIEDIQKQPAGLGRNILTSVAEAVTYLKLRFPTISAESMEIDNGTTRTLRSAIEVIEDQQLFVKAGDVATCVTYLLSDVYEIDTLVVFVNDGENSPCPMTVNMIKMEDGYWFLNPSLIMNQSAASSTGNDLPQMRCASLDSYVDSIWQNFDINCIFKVANGDRFDYQVASGDLAAIEGISSSAELVWSNPAA